MKIIYGSKRDFAVCAALVVVLTLGFGWPAQAANWNFQVAATEVKPMNGQFRFPVAEFGDGRCKHFVYKHSPSQWIRFFIVQSSDGVVRAAFDACDVCFRSRKGYVQTGNKMTCINCGLKFPLGKINVVKGGCNPAPLKRTVQGEQLVIALQDVMSGQHFFQ